MLKLTVSTSCCDCYGKRKFYFSSKARFQHNINNYISFSFIHCIQPLLESNLHFCVCARMYETEKEMRVRV